MKHAKLVLFEILVGLLLASSVKAIFPYDAIANSTLKLIYGRNGHPNATEVLAIMTLTTGDYIKRHGYPYEEHVIMTSDGYLLEMHRIPNTKNGLKNIPIIMAPGLLSDSGCYVFNGAQNSPAFIFWNAGYDVWLHNNRGTRYGRKHQTLSPDLQKEFWNFSFHEMGIYDIPAAIDYVTSITKSKQVYLLGHSMSGATMAIFLAEKPEYSDKVKAAFLLAPAIINTGTFFPFVHYWQFLREVFLFVMDDMEVFPYTNNTLLILESFFSTEIGTLIRAHINLVPEDYEGTQDPFLENISKSISGASVKVMRHFLQLTNYNGFRKYDYGTEGNMAAYGMATPPEYGLDKIDVPVSLFYGLGDILVVPYDVIRAGSRFKNLVSLTLVNDPKFDHLDFLISKNVKFLLYDIILFQMSVLEPKTPIVLMTSVAYMLIFVMFFFTASSLIMFFLRKSRDGLKDEV